MRTCRQSTPFFMGSALRRKLTYRWTPGRKTASRIQVETSGATQLNADPSGQGLTLPIPLVLAYPQSIPGPGAYPDESPTPPALMRLREWSDCRLPPFKGSQKPAPYTGRAFCYRGYRQDEYRTCLCATPAAK